MKNNSQSLKDYNDVLKVEDVQAILAIGRNTAYRLIQTKQLRCIKIGRSIRIPKRFLLEYLEGNFENQEKTNYEN